MSILLTGSVNQHSLMTMQCRLAFVSVDEPTSIPGAKDAKPYYQLVALIPQAAPMDIFNTAYNAAGQQKWGGNWPTVAAAPGFDSPLADQGTFRNKTTQQPYEGFTPGLLCFRTKAEKPVGLFDWNGQPAQPGAIYSGCHAIVKCDAAAWTYMGRNGVSFWLRGVRKVKDDVRFSGSAIADSAMTDASLTDAIAAVNADGAMAFGDPAAPAAVGHEAQLPPAGAIDVQSLF